MHRSRRNAESGRGRDVMTGMMGAGRYAKGGMRSGAVSAGGGEARCGGSERRCGGMLYCAMSVRMWVRKRVLSCRR